MAKKAKSKSSSKRTLSVNMSNVERGGARRLPEGDYKVTIKKAEKGENQNSGNAQLIITYEVISDEQKGKTVKDYMAVTEKALWRIGNLLDAVGMKWSQKTINIPLDKLEGRELGVTLVDDEYGGKIRSKIADFLDEETINGILSDEEPDDEDEDDLDDEDEDEDDDDEDDDDDLDEVDVDDEL
jgi:hypothetical protein